MICESTATRLRQIRAAEEMQQPPCGWIVIFIRDLVVRGQTKFSLAQAFTPGFPEKW